MVCEVSLKGERMLIKQTDIHQSSYKKESHSKGRKESPSVLERVPE
jgi:hypothetical protein